MNTLHKYYYFLIEDIYYYFCTLITVTIAMRIVAKILSHVRTRPDYGFYLRIHNQYKNLTKKVKD